MARYAVPVALACVYIIGATWVVRNEGRQYRESLRRAIPAAPAPPAARQPDVEVRETTKAPAESLSQKREGEAPSEPRTAMGPARTEPRPPRNSPPTARAPAAPRPIPEADARPAAAEARSDRVLQWKKDPIWSQPMLVKEWDLSHFTIEDEQRLGEQLNSLILQLNQEDSGSGLRRVRKVAEPLVTVLNPKVREYRFFVLNSDVANAFSHPGGYVYVSRKLLEMIPEDNDALLEFVLGHEIAHVELRHALECLSARDLREFHDGTLSKLYLLIIPRGYFEAQEYAADAWVYNRMKRLHRSDHDCLTFLRILDNYARANGFEHGRGKPEDLLKQQRDDPKADRAFSSIDNHLRSHPAAYQRLSRLKELRSAPHP